MRGDVIETIVKVMPRAFSVAARHGFVSCAAWFIPLLYKDRSLKEDGTKRT
jgi:hypothetical protein